MPAAPPSAHTNPKLFLSYAHDDQPKVQDLYKRLVSDGFSVWMDVTNLTAGSRWQKEILRAINDADATIVCLSRSSTSRIGFLEREMSTVFKAAEMKPGYAIIPVRLEECPIPAILKTFYYVDLFVEDGYERVLRSLYALESRTSASTDSPSGGTSHSTDAEGDQALNDAQLASGDVDETIEDEPSLPTVSIVSISPSTAPLTGGIDITLTGVGFQLGAKVFFGATQSPEVNVESGNRAYAKLPASTQSGVVAVRIDNPDGTRATISSAFTYDDIDDTAQVSKVAPGESGTQKSIKEGLAEEARDRNALNDKPIDNVTSDRLGFSDYVFALRDFVASQSTTTPLSISINGAWGSGKSSLMRMLQQELEPNLPNLWRIQLQWLAGWLRGTFFWGVGQLLIKAGIANSDYIRLGFAFDPSEDVTDKNFDQLFGKCVDYSLEDSLLSPAQLRQERDWRLTKTRFWAREAARRRKMTPRQHPTVWFNAWKFNEQEQVWAALATAVLSQLKRKYGFFTRLAFVTQLTFKRTDKLGTLKQLLRKFAVPLILAAVVALYLTFHDSLPGFLQVSQQWKRVSNRLVWLAPALAAMWQALKAIEDPFKLPTEELVDQPNYKAKIGFIGTFEEDFQRIVSVAVRRSIFWQPRKLVIFIDDLDRCSPAQTAGIVEAINLFLDSVGCVFVLGMDMTAVAISIEVKYRELAERMRQDAPDSISPGVLFLDKIVQIPFNVPRPNRPYINALVKQITEPQTRELPAIRARITADAVQSGSQPSSGGVVSKIMAQTTIKNAPVPVSDRAGFAQEDIRAAIAFASNLLKENPRQVKRFINLFRLQVYVAHERGMLSDKNEFGLTPRKLAVWVAWYMQWPDIVKLLSSPANSAELRKYLAHISAEYISRVDDQDPDAGWLITSQSAYLEYLKTIRASQSDAILHWSQLPWPLWIRDFDFLQCLKELERYWSDPELLESILDMSQVTVKQSPPSQSTVAAASAANVVPIPPDQSTE